MYVLRPVQEELIANLKEDDCNHIVEAPVGSGKSLIGYEYALWNGLGTIIIAPSNALLDQYVADSNMNLMVLKGRKHYNCKHGGMCDDCRIDEENRLITDDTKKKPKCKDCDYRITKQNCLHHLKCGGLVVTNPNMYFYVFRKDFAGLIVYDEAHNLPGILDGFYGFDLTFPDKNNDLNVYDALVKEKEYLVYRLNNKTFKVSTVNRIINKIERISYVLKIGDLSKYVYSEGKIVHLDYPSNFSHFNYGNEFLMMSATYGNMKVFRRILGLKKDVKVIKGGEPFKGLTIIGGYAKHAYGKHHSVTVNGGLNFAIGDAVDKILKLHEGENGIVACTSKSIANAFLRAYPHFIGGSKERDEDIDNFIENGGVLCRPYLYEGLDLKDDLCRFIILPKMPRERFDDINKRLNEMYAGYYRLMTLRNLEQLKGRGVRHKDDYCTLYILDKSRW